MPASLRRYQVSKTGEVPGSYASTAPARPREGTSLSRALGSARLAIAVLLVTAIGLNAWLTWHASMVISELRARELELVRQSRALQGNVPAMLSQARGYVITQEAGFLDGATRERQQAEVALQRLSDLTQAADEQAAVRDIGERLHGVIAGVERRTRLVQQNRADEARAELIQAQDEQASLFALLGNLVERQEAVLGQRLDEIQRERILALLVSTLILGAIGLVATVLMTRSRQELERSHERLQGTAAQLAGTNAVLAEANMALRETAEARDRALRDLEAALRQRDEFMASVSHDLQNPLALIKGQAQLLLHRLNRDGAPTPKLHAGLAQIDAAAGRMSGLIHELLDVARLEVGQPLELNRRAVDLVALTSQVMTSHQRSTDRHQLRLVTNGQPVVGQWDAPRLERVLGNLLSNAVKYSPQGGEIAISVGREEAGGAGQAVLAVRDQGVGIPAADLPRIFERFHRAENVTGRIKGTGLGPAGARQIVELHGGSLTAESQEGAGSTFTLRLPLAPPEQETDGPGADDET